MLQHSKNDTFIDLVDLSLILFNFNKRWFYFNRLKAINAPENV